MTSVDVEMTLLGIWDEEDCRDDVLLDTADVEVAGCDVRDVGRETVTGEGEV